MPRMTTPSRMVLAAMLYDPAEPRYGLELCDLVGLASQIP